MLKQNVRFQEAGCIPEEQRSFRCAERKSNRANSRLWCWNTYSCTYGTKCVFDPCCLGQLGEMRQRHIFKNWVCLNNQIAEHYRWIPPKTTSRLPSGMLALGHHNRQTASIKRTNPRVSFHKVTVDKILWEMLEFLSDYYNAGDGKMKSGSVVKVCCWHCVCDTDLTEATRPFSR